MLAKRRYRIVSIVSALLFILTGLPILRITPVQASPVQAERRTRVAEGDKAGINDSTPTVNGLFYGDGDNTMYQLYSVSEYGSGLYVYYDAPNTKLYVALVVTHDVNDMVCSDVRDYTSSAGWGPGRNCKRGTDSEFAEFTLECAPGSPNSWTWKQAMGCELDSAPPPSDWKSDATCPSAEGTIWPTSTQASTSWVANANDYQTAYPYSTPWPGSRDLPWDMYTGGTDLKKWTSPFVSSDPNDVTQVPGYPVHTPYDQFGSGYSPAYGWEWSMIYEWSVDLGPGGTNCGDDPIWLVTGSSHHSPSKNDDENDDFPPPDPNDPPPILADWGDLPDFYGTLFASDGPRHYLTVNGPYLGQDIRNETDGQPTATATGDGSEEDGVTINLTDGTLQAFVSNGPALLGGWFDWNNDGDFDDSGEFFSWNVATGLNTLPFTIGTGFDLQSSTQLYSRFRLFSDATAAPGGSLDQGDYLGEATNGEVEDYLTTPAASIGNRVWLDENSDGYQDAGEPGIPNVQVNLYDAQGNLMATTYTDSDGRYLFPDLWPGTYYVDVLDGTDNQAYTLPFVGMTQTPPSTLALADFGNQAHTTAIPNTSLTGYPATVDQGEENLTADFGYNYPPAGDVNDGTGTGAIGDRVWSDADGDGAQDPGEPGLAGVAVTLYYDPDGDGVYDTVYATTTTDATGSYIFDNLPPGAYTVEVTPPAGYTQTGDPDDFGQPASDPDNQTTTPIILAPGDVFLNADFGYQPPDSQDNNVGDRVWFDADADGVQDGGEPGIPGVTVSLIEDTNGNGTWDPGEPIVGTTVTDADGAYLFTGVPDGDYLVWANDVDNVLDNKVQTYDNDGVGTPNISAVALDPTGANPSPVTDLAQDFGYTAPDQDSTSGLIGDRVWLDTDGDGVQDANEAGLEGIRVELRDSTGAVVGITYTDPNGYYAFGGLPAGTYTVVVSPPAGMTQTYDADGIGTSSANRSTVTIAAGEINLLQDFGYRGTGTVGNLVWEDLNADGDVDAGEPGIDGVTLDLYWDLDGNGVVDAGEPLVGSTTTAPDGSYLFSGLPTDDGGGNAQFVAVVTDEAQVLNGYWHSLGTAGADNNSQTDPYAVTLTPGAPDNLTADFGYYLQPAALGNRVWDDLDQDGIQDAGEAGIAGVAVTMTVSYANGDTVTMVTTTDADGFYSFGNLLLDEDHASSTAGTPNANQPVYTISVATPTDYEPTLIDQGANDMVDSDDHSGIDALATQGQVDVTPNDDPNAETDPIAGYDFGFHIGPTAVKLLSFTATPQAGHILLAWETATEWDTVGFNLYRREMGTDAYARINASPIPSLGPEGGAYTFADAGVTAGVTYEYLLEDVDWGGRTAQHGPKVATALYTAFLPLVER